jgi:hypothetical protein
MDCRHCCPAWRQLNPIPYYSVWGSTRLRAVCSHVGHVVKMRSLNVFSGSAFKNIPPEQKFLGLVALLGPRPTMDRPASYGGGGGRERERERERERGRERGRGGERERYRGEFGPGPVQFVFPRQKWELGNT